MSEWNPNLPPAPPMRKRPQKPVPYREKQVRKKPYHPFERTYLGRSLKLYAPLEFDMLMAVAGAMPPNADFIEQLSYSSRNPYFKTKLFRRHLIGYRQTGCRAEHLAPLPTPKQKMEALRIRKRQMYGI